ncbi:MAG: hypothetical protein KDA59_25075, partial [Planctomycetales bacterium]|nr:hypothetical protein [Planctomycetales bacterium]
HAAASATSKAAALSIADLTPGMRGRVYAHIVGCRDRGATREECAISLGMRMSTAAARANELMRLGLVREHGTRPTSSGRMAAVLIATPREDA